MGCRRGRASSSRGKINDSSDGTLNAAAVYRRMQRDKRGRPNNVIFPYAHLIRESAPTESIPPPPSMAWSNASVSAEEIEAEEGVDAPLCSAATRKPLCVSVFSCHRTCQPFLGGQVPSPPAVINRAKRTVKRDGPFKTRKIGSVNDDGRGDIHHLLTENAPS